MQLSFQELDDTSSLPTVASISYGECFRDEGDKIYLKVRPVGQLLNSTLVSDVVGRGDCLCVDMSKGSLHIFASSKKVNAVAVNVLVNKIY